MVLQFLYLLSFNALLLYALAQPLGMLQKLDFAATVRSERTWLWGWAWGSESTVSVIDRTPVVSFSSRPGISAVTYLFSANCPSFSGIRPRN